VLELGGLPHERGDSMSKLLAAVALVGLIAVGGRADNPKSDQPNQPSKKEKPVASLKIGDPAPALKASKWLQGEEVREFERGKVYVVEFWATWCGWCIACMPDSADLQAQYKDRGVTFIYYSVSDADSTEEKVAAFVKKRGPKLKFTFAHADDRATYDAWATAAGRGGIFPCTFVADKTGRIAYVGHSAYLPAVLPLVVAGNRTAQQVGEEAKKIMKEWSTVSATIYPDHHAGLSALKKFDAKYPSLGNTPVMVRAKLGLLPSVGEIAEVKKFAEAVIAKAIEQENPMSLAQVAALLRNGSGKESRELMAVAVKAAEAHVRMAGDQDVLALIELADTYRAVGERAKAREYVRKAGPLVGDNLGRLINLANICCALGDKADAKEYARKAGQAAGDKSAAILLELAKTCTALDDKAEARSYLQKVALKAGDKDERTLIDLANAYAAIGEDSEAKTYLRKAGESLDDKDLWRLLGLSETCCALGEKAEARKYAGKVGQIIGDDNPRALLRLADAYFAMGDKMDARKYGRKAVAAASGEFAPVKHYMEEATRKFDDEKPAPIEPQKRADANSKVRALQEERLATLKEIAAEWENVFRHSRCPPEDVWQAKLLVLRAELELCDSDRERVAIHEKIVALAKETEETRASQYKAQRLSHSDLLTAKANRLEAEVALERAKAKAAAPKKERGSNR
jgi:tetratricopeptide (TPR) repeat protein/thiol-disulfide isomerase/thioredoxin